MASSELTTTYLDFTSAGTQAKFTASASTLTLEGVASGTCLLKGLTDPSAAQDAATKNYVDSVAVGLFWKNPARVATTGNLSIGTDLEAGDTLDGVVLVAGDRVLVKDQGVATENGIYVASVTGAASRSNDLEVGDDADGIALFVTEGTQNGDKAWVQTDNPAIVGTDSLTFIQFSNSVTPPGGSSGQVQYNSAGNFGGITGIVTNGTTTMSWSDSSSAIFGTSNDLTLTHNGTNSVVTNTTGDLQLVSTDPTGALVQVLGTATSATSFQIQDSGTNLLFQVAGDNIATHTGLLFNLGTEGTTYTLQGVDATTPATTGGFIHISSGDGNTTGNGANLTLTSGEGGSTDGTQGGNIILSVGGTGATNGDGGGLFLSAGSAAGTGTPGNLFISGGLADIDGNGGNIFITAGDAGETDTNAGGDVNIASGENYATNGDGGNITLTAQPGTGTGTDGQIALVQNGNTYNWPIDTPAVGEALVVNAFGGSTATLEWATVANAQGTAGQVQYTDGAGGFVATVFHEFTYYDTFLNGRLEVGPILGGGAFIFKGIDGPSAGTTGSGVRLISGDGNTTGNGGLTLVSGGDGGASSGNGGSVNLHGGQGGTTNGDGGNVNLIAGANQGTGDPGIIILRTGSSSATDTGFLFRSLDNTALIEILAGSEDPTAAGEGTMRVTGGASFTQSVYGEDFNATSDIRMKKNITEILDPLSKLCKIKGYEYEWKRDTTGKRQLGVIAQQLEEVGLENIVSGNENQKAVNYNSLIPLLIEAVKQIADDLYQE